MVHSNPSTSISEDKVILGLCMAASLIASRTMSGGAMVSGMTYT